MTKDDRVNFSQEEKNNELVAQKILDTIKSPNHRFLRRNVFHDAKFLLDLHRLKKDDGFFLFD